MNESPSSPAAAAELSGDGTQAVDWLREHARGHGIVLDAAQEKALRHFGRLYQNLLELERADSWLTRLLGPRRRNVRGLYLWGGVGRGKSFLMDTFFVRAPLAQKERLHFHRFMQDIHHRLRELQGQEDPLAFVARGLVRRARLICLDEFQVTDITDAMLMRRLLEGMFEHGAVLVTTSNLHPDDLYKHGLQREQFLPAIALLKENLEVVNVDAGIDYRLRLLEQAGVYHYPLGDEAERKLTAEFDSIASGEGENDVILQIEDRPIRTRRVGGGIAWFDFSELCEGPRGQADYIELAKRFHTVLLSNVPQLRPSKLDAARRFTWLVDEFYDRRVKLVLSAEKPVQDLFAVAGSGDAFLENLNASFVERTVSRLIEMQTHEYLALAHGG